MGESSENIQVEFWCAGEVAVSSRRSGQACVGEGFEGGEAASRKKTGGRPAPVPKL